MALLIQILLHMYQHIERQLKENKGNIDYLKFAKDYGFSDRVIAHRFDMSEAEVYQLRKENDILPVYKMVDTYMLEFI